MATPKAERNKQKKRREQKHTKPTNNNINQATSHITATHNNNMHAHVSTPISRKLWYYGLICCGGVHEK